MSQDLAFNSFFQKFLWVRVTSTAFCKRKRVCIICLILFLIEMALWIDRKVTRVFNYYFGTIYIFLYSYNLFKFKYRFETVLNNLITF